MIWLIKDSKKGKYFENFWIKNSALYGAKTVNKTNVYFIKSNALSIYKCIPESTKFDLIIADPPTGVLDKKKEGCSWDTKIDDDILIRKMISYLKPNGVLVLFSHHTCLSNWYRLLKTKLTGEVFILYWNKKIEKMMTNPTYCKCFFWFSES